MFRGPPYQVPLHVSVAISCQSLPRRSVDDTELDDTELGLFL